MVVGAIPLGDAAGVLELGIALLFETDGERADCLRLRRHACHERARVDAPGEERADGDVRDEPLPNRGIKERAHARDGLVLGHRHDRSGRLPVPALCRPPVPPYEHRRRLELTNSGERVDGSGHVPEAQIERDRVAIG